MTETDARARPKFMRKELSKVAEILEGKKCWENILYGYSVYETEGHFLPYSREINAYCTEPTQVIKFILTNYVTYELEELVHIPVMNDKDSSKRIATVLSLGFPIEKEFVNDAKATELYCAYLHYKDISNHIVTEISREVLLEEDEVWAQSWHTILDRRLKVVKKGRAGRIDPADLSPEPPIAQTKDDKERLFGENHKEVLCVIDYCPSFNPIRP